MSSARERIHQNKLETTAEANEGPYLGTRNEIGSSSKPAELSLNVEIHPKYIGRQILHEINHEIYCIQSDLTHFVLIKAIGVPQMDHNCLHSLKHKICVISTQIQKNQQ